MRASSREPRSRQRVPAPWPGKGTVRQSYTVGETQVVGIRGDLEMRPRRDKSGNPGGCLDAKNKVVMDQYQPADPKAVSEKGHYEYLYFKTAPRTVRMVLSIEKEREGIAIADDAAIHDYDKDRRTFTPTCDLDRYMEPLWKATTITNETVLLYSPEGKPASGSLLFTPERILSVKSNSSPREFAPVERSNNNSPSREYKRTPLFLVVAFQSGSIYRSRSQVGTQERRSLS